MTTTPFVEFPKIARLSREVIVTEKIDGTNASIYIGEDGEFLTGSRTRWITPEEDNHGFSKWAHLNQGDLMNLGPGTHFGEWWGAGIQRRYGLDAKRFSLFNTARWVERHEPLGEKQQYVPECCHVVPILYVGIFDTVAIQTALENLRQNGSVAAPGFMNPEGVVVYHSAANVGFKKTILKDEVPKGQKA